MVDQKRKARKIPVRKVSSEEMRAELDKRIRVFEHRYEMSSEKMAVAYSLGLVRETAEIVEWMQVYHVRKYLDDRDYLNETIPMIGIPTITTEQSTKSD